ncbi:MAG: hypothetical protein E7A72_08070 [Actinomyces urogenitalis]|uniref:hypothetical protein n=1 Tax=Actinomyces urogenitalis TaxID=103621 RepID=UPI002904318F|nr:hypothetical protein [Actinomyces urogenitalis]
MTLGDAMSLWEAVRGIGADPMTAVIWTGLVWPVVQAVLDRPWWTPQRRAALLITVALVASVVIWLVSSYPLDWRLLATQASGILGIAWAVYQALSTVRVGDIRLIDWIGVHTPGGETRADYQARHLAAPPVPQAPDPDGTVTDPTWAPLHPADEEGQ